MMIKSLPTLQHIAYKLIKGYFNSYSRRLEITANIGGSKRVHKKIATNYVSRVLVSKPEIKHTNNSVNITVYLYNNRTNRYNSVIQSLFSIIKNNNYYPNFKYNTIKANTLNTLDTKQLNINNYISNIGINKSILDRTILLNKLKDINVKLTDKQLDMILMNYANKLYQRDILSVYYKQLLDFNKLKFNTIYANGLINELSIIYNKPVKINFVNLKYIYLNSSLYSQLLVGKIANRNNNALSVLTNGLHMLQLPVINRSSIYEGLYNKKLCMQNPSIDNLSIETRKNNNINNLSKSINTLDNILISSFNNSTTMFKALHVFDSLKDKHVSGIRIKIAGRLTKRYTAARSLHKLRYKGNIRDLDCSDKNLSSALFRGYAKSNVQYSFINSKVRTGSFGLKG